MRENDALGAVVEILRAEMMIEAADPHHRRHAGIEGGAAQRGAFLQIESAVLGIDEQEVEARIGGEFGVLGSGKKADAVAVGRFAALQFLFGAIGVHVVSLDVGLIAAQRQPRLFFMPSRG